MELNQNQQQVIQHTKGPLLIVAGAGTGKTAVITAKITHLIETKKAQSDQILALTFTQKAAEEMLSRLDTVMPLGYEEPMIGTFHGICDRILKDEGLHVGLATNYQIMSAVDQWILVKQHLFRFQLKYFLPLGNPIKFISGLLGFFSKLQDECVTPAEIKAYLKTKKAQIESTQDQEAYDRDREIFTAYEIYQNLKRENSLLDFGDLIIQTIDLFKTRPSILQKYQKLWRYVFVDEFQDTNYAQYELIKTICPGSTNPNLIVVGDDDQSIYKFRGASVSNILQFIDDYPTAKQVVLTQNYRSTQAILDSAYRLIGHNNPDRLEVKLDISKKLASQTKNQTGEVISVELENQTAEVDWVIKKIFELVAKNDITFKDIAILGRANAHLDNFVAGLKHAGIPYQQIGGRGLFNQPEIEALLNFLVVVADPSHDLNLFAFLNFPVLKLDPALVLKSIQTAKFTATPLWQVIQADEYYQAIVTLITKYQKLSATQTVSQIIYDFIITSQYIQFLVSEETVENALKIKNINLLFEKIKHYENENNPANLIGFIDVLKLWQEAGENPSQATIEDIDTVSVMTAHAGKGLEFAVVFIVNAVAGRFPASGRKDAIEFPPELVKEPLADSQTNVQEERRLMYVALTRAKNYLYVTFAGDYGGVRKRIASGFLNEAGLTKLKVEASSPSQLLASPSSPEITHLSDGKVEIKELSYTQIDTFKGCPLKYKYRYILKIPTLPYHTLTFGRSVHETLYEFHRLAQQDKHLTKAELLELFTAKFDETGYDSPEHKQLRFDKALVDLGKYFDQHSGLFGTPIHLERSFKFKIGDVIINGKIDRIDESANGLEIIDYKTGSPKDQAKVDKDDQLSLYALAASESLGLAVDKLSLYFIESGQKVETVRSQKKLDAIKTKFAKEIEKMKTSSFPARPDKRRCSFCEYNRICPFRAK